MLTLLIVAFVILALGIGAMAIGVILSKGDKSKELRGSCGGPDFNPDCCRKKGNGECKKHQ